MRIVEGRPIKWILALTLVLWSCHLSRPRSIVFPTPWRDAPVSQEAADAIKAGMSREQVVALAGNPRAGGGVSEAPSPPFGPGKYSVASASPFGQPDWMNSTWIYVVSGDASGPGERYLFVEVKDGVVARAYQGGVASWSTN
jgi:hypothetical protein